MRRWWLVLAVGAALAASGPARAADYCCVVKLTASYDAKSKRLSASWGGAPAGIAAVEIRAASRLGADGVTDLSASGVRGRPGAGRASVGAGPLATILEHHGGVFVQVRFVCAKRTPKPYCTSGAFWSHPAHVTLENATQAAGGGGGSGLSVTQHRVTLKSNGTKACEDLLGLLREEITALNANTAAAQRAQAEGKSTKPLEAKQARLYSVYQKTYAAAKAACAKK